MQKKRKLKKTSPYFHSHKLLRQVYQHLSLVAVAVFHQNVHQYPIQVAQLTYRLGIHEANKNIQILFLNSLYFQNVHLVKLSSSFLANFWIEIPLRNFMNNWRSNDVIL